MAIRALAAAFITSLLPAFGATAQFGSLSYEVIALPSGAMGDPAHPTDVGGIGGASLHIANLIPKNGKEDPRRRLTQAEISMASGVGFFHGPPGLADFVGTGFVAISRRVVVTAAHNFAQNGAWKSYVRGPDGELNARGARFYSDACDRSYSISTIEVSSLSPNEDRSNDVGLVTLDEPVCSQAQPLIVLALSDDNLQRMFEFAKVEMRSYMLVPAWQREARGQPRVAKLIDEGMFTSYADGETKKTVRFTASILPGASGGPVVGKFSRRHPGTDVAVAVVVSEPLEGGANTARVIDGELAAKIELLARENP